MMTQKLMNCNKILHKSALQYLIVTVLGVTGLTACGGGLSGDENETDPVVVDNPVAFIKRPLQFDEDEPTVLAQSDIRNPAVFNPGAVLYIKNRATPSADAIDITSGAFPDPEDLNDEGELLYDVKDLDVSYDGRKLLFAMRAPEIEDADDEDQPKWNIWEYDVDSNLLRQISPNDEDDEDDGDDIAPTYLPDGRILFSSTRQQFAKGILQDEGKSQYTAQDDRRAVDNFVLHVMNADGTDIRQLTYNQSHDLDPFVMSDGRIVFSRWDNARGTANNGMNLYQINPDGTGLTYLYGRHSHTGGIQFVKPQQAENGNIVVQLRQFLASPTEWQPTEVDFRNYVELNVPLVGTGNQGHYPVVNGMEVNEDGLSMNGVYGVAFPLYDGSGRYLTSWSPCLIVPVDSPEGTAPLNCTQERIDSGDYEAAVPHFGLWIRDTNTDTQLPIEQESEGGVQYDEAVLMNSRNIPESLIPTEIDTGVAGDGYGIVHIRSVYDFGNPGDAVPGDQPARYIRIEKPVSMPSDDLLDFDNTAFGFANPQVMREILGYAPVEMDGSVKVAVPANVAFAISVLNADGESIYSRYSRHRNWLQVAPGETLQCNGCHTPNSTVPHGRPDAEPDSIIEGATLASAIDPVNRLTPDLPIDGSGYADLSTLVPTSPTCETGGDSLCRITINYPQHIHPLWSLDRREFEEDGVTLVEDHTCTSCHTNSEVVDVDENDDIPPATVAKIPDGQLDLSSEGSCILIDGDGNDAPPEPNYLKSYCELLAQDRVLTLNEAGNLEDLFAPVFEADGITPVYVQLEISGVPQFNPPPPDGDGAPIMVQQTRRVPVSASMSTNGAVSSRFLDVFVASNAIHADTLTPAELKMIREWLDIGAQYYNNPFDPGVPVN